VARQGCHGLIFGPPGVGKSHVGCGIGHALIDAGYRVLYMRTSELVQRLQAARQSLQLPQALAKLDRYDLLILDDISYVRKDQAETSVLFELIAERYERRSILITANKPFSGWSNVFPDPGMTVAAIDRLVHHSTIFELHKVESYRANRPSPTEDPARQRQAQRKRQSSSDNDNQPEDPIHDPLTSDIHPRPTGQMNVVLPAILIDAVHSSSSSPEIRPQEYRIQGSGSKCTLQSECSCGCGTLQGRLRVAGNGNSPACETRWRRGLASWCATGSRVRAEQGVPGSMVFPSTKGSASHDKAAP